MLYAYALRRVDQEETAQDLVQDCMIKALKSMGTFEGNSQFQTWLVGILKHQIYDFYRRKKRVQIESIDENFESTHPDFFLDDGHWKNESLEAELQQRLISKHLQSCLDCLDTKYRLPFLLKERDGLSGIEIADLLNINENSLYVLLYRARLQLKTCIEKGTL